MLDFLSEQLDVLCASAWKEARPTSKCDQHLSGKSLSSQVRYERDTMVVVPNSNEQDRLLEPTWVLHVLGVGGHRYGVGGHR